MINGRVALRPQGHGRSLARRASHFKDSPNDTNSSSPLPNLGPQVTKPVATPNPSSPHAPVGQTSSPSRPPPKATARATPSQPPKAPAPPNTNRAKSTVAKSSSSAFVGKTLTPLPTPIPASDASGSKSHVSGIAIGLVLGLIGAVAIIIGVIWVVRRQRAKSMVVPNKRWSRKAEVLPKTEIPGNSFSRHEMKSEGYLRLGDEKTLPVPGEEVPSIRTDAHSSFLRQSMVITPPSSTYNNPIRPISVVSSSGPGTIDKTRELVKVHRAFLPTLPDELHIQQGEMIEILKSFDDGWALCLNQVGDRGVVPLECLSRHRNTHGLEGQDRLGVQEAEARLSKRASSLYAEAPPNSY